MGLEYTDITKAEKETQWLRSDRIKLKKEDHPMKRTLAILLALVLALSVCSFAAAEDEITLTVFHYMAQTTKQAGLNAIEAAFTELHPNVKFNNIYYNQGTDYFPQLSTALSSGDQPNIIMGNPGLYPDLVTEGFVMDLSDNEVIRPESALRQIWATCPPTEKFTASPSTLRLGASSTIRPSSNRTVWKFPPP